MLIHAAMSLSYACPVCRTTMNVHEEFCRLDGTDIHDIEKCYIDIIAPLTTRPHTKFDIIRGIDGDWTSLHQDIFDRIEERNRIEEIGEVEQEGGVWPVYRLLTAEEYMETQEVPSQDDLYVIYDRGPVEGCRDNALYSMVCYYQRTGFSWEKTRELLLAWLDRVGQTGWDDQTIEELVDGKQMVYDQGYHWGNKAREAAKVIRQDS